MSTTIAALPAFSAAPRPTRDGLFAALSALWTRSARDDAAAVAELPDHLRSDIGLPPAQEPPRLRTSAIYGW